MQPGRELDKLVAEKVFGTTAPHRIMSEYNLPPFSTDIAAAWEVVEAMMQSEILGRPGDFLLHLGPQSTWHLDATKAAHHICIAALKTVSNV